MGLDNGIILKIKNREKFGNGVPFCTHESWEDEDTCEVLYWRKCWNIREVVFRVLRSAYLVPSNYQCHEFVLPVRVLEKLIYELNDCYTPEWWEEHNDSIWSFDEICGNYHYHLLNAIRLVDFLKTKDPDSYELSFYDSY